MSYVQEQMYEVTVNVTGIGDLGIWDTFEGGEVDSEARTYRPGGLKDAVALPAPAATSDVTVSRAYSADKDWDLERQLVESVGRAIRIGKKPLTFDNSPTSAKPATYSGVLKAVRTPTHDSEGDRVSRLQIVATITGKPSW